MTKHECPYGKNHKSPLAEALEFMTKAEDLLNGASPDAPFWKGMKTIVDGVLAVNLEKLQEISEKSDSPIVKGALDDVRYAAIILNLLELINEEDKEGDPETNDYVAGSMRDIGDHEEPAEDYQVGSISNGVITDRDGLFPLSWLGSNATLIVLPPNSGGSNG